MAREGTAFHHRSLLSHNLLSLRVLSCVLVTIRGFVFLSFSCDCLSLGLRLFCFFVLISQNGRFFVFLRNIHSSIEILKIKILDYSYPPSQHFFVTKAFSRLFLSRRKVALCQSDRMAHTPRTVPINVPIDRPKSSRSLAELVEGHLERPSWTRYCHD